MAFEKFEKVEMKSFRVSLPMADYEVLKKVSEWSGFDIDFLVRSVVHDEILGFLEIHPELKN